MSKTALLVMDLQNGIVSRFSNDPDYLPRVQKAIVAARKASMPVIYVVVKFRKGYPEVSPNNKAFHFIKSSDFQFFDGEPSTEVHESVAPQEGDILVSKRRVCAFTGSDLEVVLRSLDVNHIVLCGIATSGVVLSTVRAAADMDYRITVLSDGCADRDEEVHRVLTEKVFPSQADVVTCEQWTVAEGI